MSFFDSFSQTMEKRVMPIANKMANQRHLSAIRDAFISLLPINLTGEIMAIIKSPPVTEETTNGFLLAWKAFADNNGLLFNWIYAFTLGALSLYICIGVTNFLCKHYKINNFIPILFSILGFMLLVTTPEELSWSQRLWPLISLMVKD